MKEENIVIGIEGYVGAGKTSICRELLNRIPNSIILHGGNLYRTIVYALLNLGKDKEKLMKNLEKIDIKQMMDLFHISIEVEDRETVFYIDGKPVEEATIQSAESSLAVSKVSEKADNSKLFVFARDLIDKFKKTYNVIVSGRALVQIYPNLDYHFLITASLEERVKRKSIQYKGEISEKEIKKNILTRDNLQEKAGYYKIYPNTIEVDVTDCSSAYESTNKVMNYIKLPALY